MELTSLFTGLKILIWGCAAARHYKKELFLFFLINVLSDPFVLLLTQIITLSSSIVYITLTYLLFFTLKPSIKFASIPVLISAALLLISYEPVTINLSIVTGYFFMAILFIRYAILDAAERNYLTFYFPLLIFYTVMVVVQGWMYAFGADLLNFFFYNAVQVFIGIYFIFFTMDTGPKIFLRNVTE